METKIVQFIIWNFNRYQISLLLYSFFETLYVVVIFKSIN